MSRVRINSPLPNTSNASPMAVTVSWEIDTPILVAAQKKYDEAKKKYDEEVKKAPEEKRILLEVTLEPPPPFLVRLRIEGDSVFYQLHFTATYSGTVHVYSDITAAAGAQRIRAYLVSTQSTSLQSDDVVLDSDSIPLTVT